MKDNPDGRMIDGDKLRAQRLLCGLSQMELCVAAKIGSQTAYSNMENNKYAFRTGADRLKRLARVLQCDIDDICVQEEAVSERKTDAAV